MGRFTDWIIEHLLRRAGFGARPDEIAHYGRMSYAQAVETLIQYDRVLDDVDSRIGQAGFAGTTSRGAFSPSTSLADARQRWLFRMLHTNRPLQEKMTLFWHDHFATAHSKIAGALGAADGVRYMAAKPSEDAAGVRGQVEMLRDRALGNFRDIVVSVAQDPAMLIWLDGRTNTKAKPQENFAREIMELFTLGVDQYTEADVYAGARVFSGWNLRRSAAADAESPRYEFFYNAAQHDTAAKTFSFPIGAGGGTIPARPASDGQQDGIDLIDALVANPATARHLATKLYRFFVSDLGDPDPLFVSSIASVYLQSRYDMKTVMREVLLSPQFRGSLYQRYGWPVEFVVRALKDIGWVGFSLNDALTPLSNMGQLLFEPPNVAGWRTGPAWFSTGAMLARMNFAATLAANQRANLAGRAKGHASSPEAMLSFFQDELPAVSSDNVVRAELIAYLRASGAWTGGDAQLELKAPGLVHLLAGSAEYQFV